MKKRITNPLPAPLSEQLVYEANNVLNKVRAYAAPLTDKEKVGLRTVAEGREEYVHLISRIAIQHKNSLARADNPHELIEALKMNETLEQIRQAALEFLETITDIHISNSADIMVMADRYAVSLQSDRKRNTSLNTVMNEVDDWNKQHAKNVKEKVS